MDVTSLGFRTDLMLLRMGGSVVAGHPTHLVVRTPANPFYWWGNFVLCGAPLRTGDGARWVREFRTRLPGAAHLAIGIDGTDGDPGDAAELAEVGLTAQVSTVLTAVRTEAPVPAPAGVVIRPLAGDGDWAQALETRLAVDGQERAADAVHREFAARKTADYRRLTEAGHGGWFGAFVDGRLRADAGLLGDRDGIARFQNVGTHPDFRRRGLATALVSHMARWGLADRGASTLVMVADPDYHAIDIYRGLGFIDAEQQVQLHRPPL